MLQSKRLLKNFFSFITLILFSSTFLFFGCQNFDFNFNSKSKVVVRLPGKTDGGGRVANTNPENYTVSNISSWTVNLISIGNLGATSGASIYQSKTTKSGTTVSFDIQEEIPLRVEVVGYSKSGEILLLGKSENFVPNIEEITNVAVFVDWNYLSVKAENLNVSLDGNNGFQLRVRVDCKESEKENISFKWYKSSTKSEENLPTEATFLDDGVATYSGNPQSLEYSDYYENYYDGTYSNNNTEYYYCLVTRKYDYVGISSVEKVIGPFQINGQSGQEPSTPSGEEQGQEQGGEQGEQEPGDEPTPPATLTSITATYTGNGYIRSQDNYAIPVPSASDFTIIENYSDNTTQTVTDKTNYSVAWKTGVTTTTAIGAVPVVITKRDENFTCEATVPVKYTIAVYGIVTDEQKIDAEKDNGATKTLGSQIDEKTWQLWKNDSPLEQTDSFTYSWKDVDGSPIQNVTTPTYNAPLNDIGTISYTRTHTITPVDSQYFDSTDNSYEIVYQLTVTDNEPSAPTTTPTAQFIEIKMQGEDNQLIRTLSVSKHEVTQKEYETYCAYSTKDPSDTYGKGDNYPAYNITWYDAIVYCNLRSKAENLTPVYTINGSTEPTDWGAKSKDVGGVTKYHGKTFNDDDWNNKVAMNQNADGYRLPTKEEWVYLARGGQNYTYAGSDNIEDVAWYDENSQNKSHEIMTKTANGYGLYDMSGNVYEWIWDLHDEFSGTERILKGGSWCDNVGSCEITDENWTQPIFAVSGYEQDNYGFRIVRTIP